MKKGNFSVEGACLTASSDVTAGNSDDFTDACVELLKSHEETLVIDLRLARRLTSTSIGVIADTHFRAQDSGKKLVIKISRALMKIFSLTNTDNVLAIEVT